MAKRTTKGTAKEKPKTEAITPDIITPDGTPLAAVPKTKTVKGRRVLPKTETFVLDADGEEDAAPEIILTDDELELAEEEDEPPPLSDVELLLQQAGNDDNFWLAVYRLTEFDADGRTDGAATKAFCMNIAPPTLDYLEKIERKYGGGAYLIRLMERGRGVRKYWTEHIAQARPQAEPQPAPAPVTAVVQPADTLKTFSEQAKEFAEVAKALGLVRPQPQPAPAAPPTAALPPVDPFKQTLDVIEQVTTISERINPPRDEPSGKAGFIGQVASLVDAIGRHAPKLAPFISGLSQVRVQPPQAAPAQPGANPPAPHPAPEPATPPNPYQETLEILVNDLIRNRRVGRTADAIDDLFNTYPEAKEQVAPLFEQDPRDVCAAISQLLGVNLLEYGHATQWIEDLQAELTGEGDEGEEERGINV